MENIKKFVGLKDIYKYGHNINTYDMAKFLAIFFMIIDHMGNFFFPETYWMRGLGRVAFPIFFFLIGYSKSFGTSWNLLIIGAIITIYRGALTGIWYPADILVSAFIARWALGFMQRKNLLHGANLAVILCTVIVWHMGTILFFAYGAIGVLFAMCGYFKRLENEGQPQKFLPAILIGSIVFDYILQTIVWDQAIYFKDIFAAVSMFLVYYFTTFEMREIEIKNDTARKIILFFSRNSLFIYWVHFMLFVLLSASLGIEDPTLHSHTATDTFDPNQL